MKVIYILLILCLVGMAYGYWGAFTLSGQKVYDEMAALTPFFTLVGSVALFVILLVVLAIQKLRKQK